jgi:hypothetical protein
MANSSTSTVVPAMHGTAAAKQLVSPGAVDLGPGTLASASPGLASPGLGGQALGAKPARARRTPVDRFLVPVPAEAKRVDPSRARSARGLHQSRNFELTTAATLASVAECLKRTHARLQLVVAGHEVPAEVVAAGIPAPQKSSASASALSSAPSAELSRVEAAPPAAGGLDLLVSLGVPLVDGPFSARCDVYDVPFLLRGQLRMSSPDGGAGAADPGQPAEQHAVLSKLRVYVLDQRRGTRVSLDPGVGTLRWARVVDGVPRIINSPVVDLAPSGVSIRLGASDPTPPAEPFVGELDLGNVKIPLLANIRRQVEGATPFGDSPAAIAGLQLDTGSGKRKLVELYMRNRLPGLVSRANISREQVCQLLGESGYLDLRQGEGCSGAWHQYRSENSFDFAYQTRDKKALGHGSLTRSYKTTWTMHQLATLSGHAESGICRRALYDFGCCVPLAFDGEQAYGLAYFNRKRRWHQLFFEMFMQWLNDDALGTIVAFDRFERSADTGSSAGVSSAGGLPPALELEAGYEIAPLEDADLLPAVALIRSQLPPLLAEALNINPTDLRSASLNGNAERTRAAFVLRSNGILLGVALCETGSTSASLFNIFNMAQFYVCRGATGPSVNAQLALLATARRFYAERGTSSPLIVAPAGSFSADAEPGTVLAEAMGCVAISGAGLRQWEHYCRLTMGQLYQRKPRSREREDNQNVAVTG